MLGKLAVAVNTQGHSIRVLNERNVSVGGNVCPLWLQTPQNCDTVGHEL